MNIANPVTMDRYQDTTLSNERWREMCLTFILRGATIIGLIVAVASSLDVLQGTSTAPWLAAVYMGAWFVLLAITVGRFAFSVRTGVLLFLIYGLAISSLLETGARGDARLFFVLLVFLASMLIDLRAGVIALLASVATTAVVGAFVLTGSYTLLSKVIPGGNLELWLVSTLILVLVAGIILLGLSMFLREFESAQRRVHQVLTNLENRVTERTSELAANTASLERYSKYMVALQDTTTDLMTNRDVDGLLQAIVARAGALVGTEHGYVFLRDQETGDMTMRVGIGTYANLVGTHAQPGVGLAGIVWQSGTSLAVDDYQSWTGRLAGSERSVLRAVVGVPLRVVGEIVGVIGLAYLEADRIFGRDEQEVLTRFAQFASVALENAQLYAQQVALAEANRVALEENKQSAERARALAEEKRQVAERASALADENRDLLEKAQAANAELSALARRLTGQGWQEFMGRKSGSLVGQSTQPHFHSSSEPILQQALEKGDLITVRENGRSLLAVPIILRGEALGAIALEGSETQGEWNADTVTTTKEVAERVALAIENARLFEQTQEALAATRRMAEREANIAAIGERLYASTDVQTVLQVAASELVQLTGRGRAVVWVPSQK